MRSGSVKNNINTDLKHTSKGNNLNEITKY